MNPKQCKNPKHECEYCQLRYSANNALGISVHSRAHRALPESAEDVTEYPAKKLTDGLLRHHQPL